MRIVRSAVKRYESYVITQGAPLANRGRSRGRLNADKRRRRRRRLPLYDQSATQLNVQLETRRAATAHLPK